MSNLEGLSQENISVIGSEEKLLVKAEAFLKEINSRELAFVLGEKEPAYLADFLKKNDSHIIKFIDSLTKAEVLFFENDDFELKDQPQEVSLVKSLLKEYKNTWKTTLKALQDGFEVRVMRVIGVERALPVIEKERSSLFTFVFGQGVTEDWVLSQLKYNLTKMKSIFQKDSTEKRGKIRDYLEKYPEEREKEVFKELSLFFTYLDNESLNALWDSLKEKIPRSGEHTEGREDALIEKSPESGSVGDELLPHEVEEKMHDDIRSDEVAEESIVSDIDVSTSVGSDGEDVHEDTVLDDEVIEEGGILDTLVDTEESPEGRSESTDLSRMSTLLEERVTEAKKLSNEEDQFVVLKPYINSFIEAFGENYLATSDESVDLVDYRRVLQDLSDKNLLQKSPYFNALYGEFFGEDDKEKNPDRRRIGVIVQKVYAHRGFEYTMPKLQVEGKPSLRKRAKDVISKGWEKTTTVLKSVPKKYESLNEKFEKTFFAKGMDRLLGRTKREEHIEEAPSAAMATESGGGGVSPETVSFESTTDPAEYSEITTRKNNIDNDISKGVHEFTSIVLGLNEGNSEQEVIADEIDKLDMNELNELGQSLENLLRGSSGTVSEEAPESISDSILSESTSSSVTAELEGGEPRSKPEIEDVLEDTDLLSTEVQDVVEDELQKEETIDSDTLTGSAAPELSVPSDDSEENEITLVAGTNEEDPTIIEVNTGKEHEESMNNNYEESSEEINRNREILMNFAKGQNEFTEEERSALGRLFARVQGELNSKSEEEVSRIIGANSAIDANKNLWNIWDSFRDNYSKAISGEFASVYNKMVARMFEAQVNSTGMGKYVFNDFVWRITLGYLRSKKWKNRNQKLREGQILQNTDIRNFLDREATLDGLKDIKKRIGSSRSYKNPPFFFRVWLELGGEINDYVS